MRADLQPHFVADVVDGDGASQWPHLAAHQRPLQVVQPGAKLGPAMLLSREGWASQSLRTMTGERQEHQPCEDREDRKDCDYHDIRR